MKKYKIVARKTNGPWLFIDSTNDLNEALRWMEHYVKNARDGWSLRIRKLVKPKVYEFMDYK